MGSSSYEDWIYGNLSDEKASETAASENHRICFENCSSGADCVPDRKICVLQLYNPGRLHDAND